MSVFGVILVRIFPHSDWMQTRITPNTGTFQTLFIPREKIMESTNKQKKTYSRKFINVWNRYSFNNKHFNVVSRLIWYRVVAERQTNVKTMCLSTLEFTKLNNVKSPLSIPTLLTWTTLSNIKAASSFSCRFYNVAQLRNNVVNMTIWKEVKK